jgi:hypothetical protein
MAYDGSFFDEESMMKLNKKAIALYFKNKVQLYEQLLGSKDQLLESKYFLEIHSLAEVETILIKHQWHLKHSNKRIYIISSYFTYMDDFGSLKEVIVVYHYQMDLT